MDVSATNLPLKNPEGFLWTDYVGKRVLIHPNPSSVHVAEAEILVAIVIEASRRS